MALLQWRFSRTCYNIPAPYCPILTAAKNGAAAHRYRWLYAPRLYITCWCQTKKGNPFGKFYLPSKDIAVCLIADFDCTWDSLRKQEYTYQMKNDPDCLLSGEVCVCVERIRNKWKIKEADLEMRTGGLDWISHTYIFPSLFPGTFNKRESKIVFYFEQLLFCFIINQIYILQHPDCMQFLVSCTLRCTQKWKPDKKI